MGAKDANLFLPAVLIVFELRRPFGTNLIHIRNHSMKSKTAAYPWARVGDLRKEERYRAHLDALPEEETDYPAPMPNRSEWSA
jgi:hypothetical protein